MKKLTPLLFHDHSQKGYEKRKKLNTKRSSPCRDSYREITIKMFEFRESNEIQRYKDVEIQRILTVLNVNC